MGAQNLNWLQCWRLKCGLTALDVLVHCLSDGVRQGGYERRFDNRIMVASHPMDAVWLACPKVPSAVRQVAGIPGMQRMSLALIGIAFAKNINRYFRFWQRTVFFHEADHVA